FNRYLIPAFPTVDILAAIGLCAIADFRLQIADWERRSSKIQHPIPQSKVKNLKSKILLGVVAIAAVINAAWWHPYGIDAFNQALGGARAGERAFLTGWGEGFEQVAAWLNQQPDITGVVTVSAMGSSLQPYMRKGVQVSGPDGDNLPRKAGYV